MPRSLKVINPAYSTMVNKRMAEKLSNGDAINLAPYKQPGGFYLIPPDLYEDDIDYCDAAREEWIWSIGRHLQTGEILASTSTCFYRNPNYLCLWLR